MTIYQTVMNEIKNSSTQGTYIQPIPVGLPVTLHYSDKGILSKIMLSETTELPFELTSKLILANVVIQRLQVYKAECSVRGVLVAPVSELKFTKLAGKIPECLEPNMEKLMSTKPELFKFYALDLSLAKDSNLPVAAALNRLTLMKFSTINGAAITSETTIRALLPQFNKLVRTLQPELPEILAFYIHSNISKVVYCGLKCGKVSKFSPFLDRNGYIHGEVSCDFGDGNISVLVSYAQIVQHQLSPNSFVVFDRDDNIKFVSAPKIFSKPAQPTLTCPVCGKIYNVPTSSVTVSCPDDHCASKLYPQIERMVAKFNLPEMSADEFMSATQSGKLTSLLDVFKLPQYAECEVTTTLANLIQAITPISLLAGDLNNISKFVHQASSDTAVNYYIHNPSELGKDLRLPPSFVARFQQYWSDSYNVEMYDAFVGCPNITLEAPSKKFEGDMILRNKIICLTGEFKHGSYDDMMSIIQSYAGTPVVEFSPQVKCVLVGHFGTPDPYIIERAKAYNIPIYRELDFFSAYQIDADLAKLHLI